MLYHHVPSTYDMACLVEPLLKTKWMFPSPLVKKDFSLLVPSSFLVMKESRSQVTMKQIRRTCVNIRKITIKSISRPSCFTVKKVKGEKMSYLQTTMTQRLHTTVKGATILKENRSWRYGGRNSNPYILQFAINLVPVCSSIAGFK